MQPWQVSGSRSGLGLSVLRLPASWIASGYWMLNGVALAILSKCCSLRVWDAYSDLPILYLFKVTFRLPSWDCFGQTELGLNVRGCGREATVCCQRTELKLHNFNPRTPLGSAGWQAAANEAFQVRCGDGFLSSLKKEIPATASSFVIHRNSFEGGFWFGGFRRWKASEASRRGKEEECILRFCLTQSPERATLQILCPHLLFKTFVIEGQTSVLAEQNEHADECTVQPVNHLLLSAVVDKRANHLKHRHHFRELRESDCQRY